MMQGEGGKGYIRLKPKQKDIVLPLPHGEMEERFHRSSSPSTSLKDVVMLIGKQIADAVVASARSSGYFKPYDASPNWQDFYDRVAAKLATETTVNDDFNVISDRILTTWPKPLQQRLYNALYTAGCRIYKS